MIRNLKKSSVKKKSLKKNLRKSSKKSRKSRTSRKKRSVKKSFRNKNKKYTFGFNIPEDAKNLNKIEVSALNTVAIMKSEEFNKTIFLFGEQHGNVKEKLCDTDNKLTNYKPFDTGPKFITTIMNEFLVAKKIERENNPNSNAVQNLDIMLEFPYNPVSINEEKEYFETGFQIMMEGDQRFKPEDYEKYSYMASMIANLHMNQKCFDFKGIPTKEDLELCPYLNDIRFHTTDTRRSECVLVKTIHVLRMYFERNVSDPYLSTAILNIENYATNKEKFKEDFNEFLELYKIKKYIKELIELDKLEILKEVQGLSLSESETNKRVSKYRKIIDRVNFDRLIDLVYGPITANNGKVVEKLSLLNLTGATSLKKFLKYYTYNDKNQLLQTLQIIEYLWFWFMDSYMILRIFKKFNHTDNRRKIIAGDITNVIIYSGAAHTEHYIELFENIGFQTVFYQKSKKGRKNCIDVKNMIPLIDFR